jgi:integral membrane protein
MTTGPATEAGLRTHPKIAAALLRYRVMAWLTGIGLIVLTYALLRYVPGLHGLPHAAAISRVLGPIHGTYYIILLITTFDLGTRVRWPWGRMLLTALAGTIPFLSFYAERRNQAAVKRQLGR